MEVPIRATAPRVVYWNNIPAPYMVDRFNALAERQNVEFEVWFNDRLGEGRSWSVDEREWKFSYRYIPTTKILGRKIHFPVYVLTSTFDVMVSLYAQPSFVFGWTIARLRGIKTCFRVLRTSDRWVRRNKVRRVVKRFMFTRVDGVETPGKDGAAFAVDSGVDPNRVHVVTHAIDLEHFQSISSMTETERDRFRTTLGLIGTAFIYVGRLWKGKGLQYLLDAFERVQAGHGDPCSLLIVGDGPEERTLKVICEDRGLRNVVFAGFQQKSDTPKYYSAADVFVFPTLGDPYGVVIDEAMACSLPIICTSAAGEVSARVKDGHNGFIVAPEDSEDLANRMITLAKSENRRREFGQESSKIITGRTTLRWAKEFEQMIMSVMGRDSAIDSRAVD